MHAEARGLNFKALGGVMVRFRSIVVILLCFEVLQVSKAGGPKASNHIIMHIICLFGHLDYRYNRIVHNIRKP
jgi:hypothetical protein